MWSLQRKRIKGGQEDISGIGNYVPVMSGNMTTTGAAADATATDTAAAAMQRMNIKTTNLKIASTVKQQN